MISLAESWHGITKYTLGIYLPFYSFILNLMYVLLAAATAAYAAIISTAPVDLLFVKLHDAAVV